MKKTKATSGKLLKFVRIFKNVFRFVAGERWEAATANEVNLNGILKRIEKDKKLIANKIKKQKSIVEVRMSNIDVDKKILSKKVKVMEDEIKAAKKKYEDKVENAKLTYEKLKESGAEEVRKIESEIKRGNKIIKNIDNFYGIDD